MADKSKHDSFIGALGKYLDPLAWAFGQDSKYTETMHGKIPRELNRLGSDIVKPFAKADKKLNPLRKIDAYDKVASFTEDKPADTAATAAAIFFGGPALLGAMGGGAGGGAGAGAGGTAGGTGGGAAAGGMTGTDWFQLAMQMDQAGQNARQQATPQKRETSARELSQIGAEQSQKDLIEYIRKNYPELL